MMNANPKVNQISYGTWCKLPAQRLCYYALDILTQNTKLMNILRAQTALYNRDDWDVRQLPALSVYYKNIRQQSSAWFREGVIYFRYQFPTEVSKDRLHEITAVMADATDNIFQSSDNFYALVDKVPGLRIFGQEINWDTKDSEQLGQNNILTLLGEYDFRIDYYIWRKYITNVIGANPIDPCVKIYKPVTGFSLNVYPEEFL